jgi:hypothetical protein
MEFLMDARRRDRNKIAAGGVYITNGVITGHESFYALEEGIDDYWHKKRRSRATKLPPLPPSDCDIYRTFRNPPIYFSSNTYFELRGVRPYKDQYPDLAGYPWRGSGQRETENNYYKEQLLAATHPFRYEYSVPVSMVEALDLADLFKSAAATFAGLIGNTYLRYRFGFSQFYQDIQTLSGITKAIESRVKELNSLSLQGGLRRNVKLFGTSWANAHDETIWSTYGHFISANIDNRRDYEIRGTVRWRWKEGVDVSLNKLEAFNQAVKAVFDLGELDASTIWNAIPWTWLVDYFVDVGSWLQANENSNLVEPYDICIVRRFRSKTEIKNLSCSDGEGLPGHISWRVHSRDVVQPGTLPFFRFSLLSEKQFLTIVALIGKFHGGGY